MGGFIYNNNSTQNILNDSELMLCTFDGIESVTGHQRDDITGEMTISRPIANEYGTQYQTLEVEYGLIKKNYKCFTQEEQRIVEAWLTSPKFSQKLELIDCKGKSLEYFYYGKFLSTQWIPHDEGYAGVMFKFKNNTAYPTKRFNQMFNMNPSESIEINCKSDELNEYTYPIITISQNEKPIENIIISNISDMSKTVTISARRNLPIILDCKHCIPKDGTTSGIISYNDLGWEDVGNIYWMRLTPGINVIKNDGTTSIQLKFEFDYPYKKVGGWL